MNIVCHKKGNILIADIIGDIDHHTSEIIKNEIEKNILVLNIKDIILNFKDVSFMDSSGVGVVIGRYKAISAMGGDLFVAEVSKDIDRIFKISGLYKIIKKFPTVQNAVEVLSKG